MKFTVEDLRKKQGRLYFPLKKYGYILKEVLNNKNRHHIKLVCSIFKHNGSDRFVSTTYARHNDYLRLVETTTYLKCNGKLIPEIAELYPRDNTAVCRYIGEFFSGYFMNNLNYITKNLVAAFEYMKETNHINQRCETFTIPSIIKISLALSEEFNSHFSFLPGCRIILPKLEKEGVLFLYGCGVEDPHIWNFRIVNDSKRIKALTTDFDYFSDRINCFWELGYFYATFRWFEKNTFSLKHKAEDILLSLIKNVDLKSEFMFWLGVLSSYCGYRDSICNFLVNGQATNTGLNGQYNIIRELDRKVTLLARELLL